jgi:hypothetical protein
MKRKYFLVALLCAAAAALVVDRSLRPAAAGIAGQLSHGNGAGSLVLLSDSYRIDRIFESMQGPYSSHAGIQLVQAPKPELVWVRGVSTEVVDKRGKKGLSQEYFCHANLSLDSQSTSVDARNAQLGTSLDLRLFTLVPGKMDIDLPEGFGIPITSDEKLEMLSMSLNLNDVSPNFDLRFQSQIDFVKDSEAVGEMKPLFMRSAYVMVPISRDVDGTVLVPDALCAMPGTTNLPGHRVSQGMSCAPPSMNASEGGKRGTNTLHWMVPPGQHTYSSDVTEQLKLGFDTTIHYATGHLHPMGESLVLRNRTTGETLLEIRSKDYAGKRGVELMEEFKFSEGLKVYKNHEYELSVTYNNPTDKPTDVMAIIYLYLHDLNFDRSKVFGEKSLGTVASGGVSNDPRM